MILGRNPALWTALIAAILNVLVIVIHVPISPDGLAALNILGVAVIGLIANASDPTTSPTFALTLKPPTNNSGNLGSPQ